MIQSALIFALGFLVAALLALLLAPVLWRRAQWLMRHRLEAVVPMTLDEVRADRDALRAEHAVAMRRLEIENNEIRAIDAEHLMEISRGREALKARAATIASREATIAELEDTISRLSRQIRTREKELSALEVSHRVASREVVQKRERIARLTEALAKAEADVAERSDSLRAHETAEAARSDELNDARREVGTLRQREASLSGALADAQTELREALERSERLDTALGAERERNAAIAADLAAADGRVREALLDLAARVVATDHPIDLRADHPDLPEGEIARRARLRDGPIAEEMAGDEGLMAEMDAAAEAELHDAGDHGDVRPTPANDDGGAITAPTREGRSPSRP